MVQAIPALALMDAGAQESLRFGTVPLGLGLAHRNFRSIENGTVSGLLRDKKIRFGLWLGLGSISQ